MHFNHGYNNLVGLTSLFRNTKIKHCKSLLLNFLLTAQVILNTFCSSVVFLKNFSNSLPFHSKSFHMVFVTNRPLFIVVSLKHTHTHLNVQTANNSSFECTHVYLSFGLFGVLPSVLGGSVISQEHNIEFCMSAYICIRTFS